MPFSIAAAASVHRSKHYLRDQCTHRQAIVSEPSLESDDDSMSSMMIHPCWKCTPVAARLSHSRNENCITARQVHSQMQKVHGTYCALAAEHVQKRQSVEPSQRGCQNDDLKIRHVDTRPVAHQMRRQRPRIRPRRQHQHVRGMGSGGRDGRAQESPKVCDRAMDRASGCV